MIVFTDASIRPDPCRYECGGEAGFRIDFLVEEKVIVEIKAVEALHQVFEAQLLTYLKLSERRLGLLINFNVPLLKEGVKRMIR